MNNSINLLKKHVTIVLCLIAITIFPTTIKSYAGTNNLGSGNDYEFEYTVETDSPDETESDLTQLSSDVILRGTNNMGSGGDYEFDFDVDTEPSTNDQIVIDIVNTHVVYLVDVTGTKTWIDNNNQDGTRPDEVIIHLYADGDDTGKSIVLSESTNWKYSFKNVPLYANGTLIDYTIVEDIPEGYTVDYIYR